jgi:hypothetical protein
LNIQTAIIIAMCMGLLTCLGGCMMPFEPGPIGPDVSQLEDGDLILTFAGAVQSWGIAMCTDPNVSDHDLPYSHVEMLFRDSHGHWMAGGISGGYARARRLSKAIKGFQHAGFFRSNRPKADRDRVATIMAQWLEDPTIRKAEFDYSLQDIPGRRDSFCCVGFINEVHREAGLAPPFATQPWQPNAFGRHLETLLRIRFDEITTVDSLKHNPDYTCVLQWRNNKMDLFVSNIYETLARLGFQWYEEGWRVRSSEGVHLGLLMLDLPEGLDNTVRTRAHITLFTKDVERAWFRLWRRGQLEGLDESEKQAKLEAICESFRNRHMVFVGHNPESQP